MCRGLNAHAGSYMSLHEFLTLIIRQMLIFRQFEELWRNDIKEGQVPEGFPEACEALNTVSATGSTDAMEQNDRRLNILRLQTYVSCWNLLPDSKSENAFMWASYAPRGVMVKTTVEKLRMTYADDWNGLEDQGFATDGTINGLNGRSKILMDRRSSRRGMSPRGALKR